MYPKKKENLKFVLSDAFIDDDGKPIEWEMRELTAEEGVEVRKQLSFGEDPVKTLAMFVGESLVVPDLHNQELLEELSRIKGRPIFTAGEALLAILTNTLIGRLCAIYKQYNDLDTDIGELIDRLKK